MKKDPAKLTMATTSMSTLKSHAFKLPNNAILKRYVRNRLPACSYHTYLRLCAVTLMVPIYMPCIRSVICFGIIIYVEIITSGAGLPLDPTRTGKKIRHCKEYLE
jgi:hypothetical protein